MTEMKSWIIKVQKGYRITLPKELMEYMGWHIGDTILFKAQADGSILLQRVVRAKSRWVREGSSQ